MQKYLPVELLLPTPVIIEISQKAFNGVPRGA